MPPSPMDKGKGENEDEKQVNVQKRERDEVGVENKTNEEIVSECERDKPKTLTSPNEKNAGSKRIRASKLSYSVEPADLENIFKHCGEIVEIHLYTFRDGRFKGAGHVVFTTTEAAQKALQLNDTELLKCRIKVRLAPEKQDAPNRSFHANNFSNLSNSFQRSARIQPVKGSDISEHHEQETEQKASKILQKTPKRLATRKEQNATSMTTHARNLSYSVERADMFRGFACVEFATAEAAQKALELDNTEMLGRRIQVSIARGKGEHNWNRSTAFQKHERVQPMKATEHSQDCEEKIKQIATKSPHESRDDNRATSDGAEIAVDANEVISLKADEVKLGLKGASSTIDSEERSSGIKRNEQSSTSATQSQKKKIGGEEMVGLKRKLKQRKRCLAWKNRLRCMEK